MVVIECKSKAAYDTQLAENDDKLIVVDFTAAWCPPCKGIKPKYKELSEKYLDVVFLMVDVDGNKETAAACGIKCMPTFFFVKNGQKVHQLEGADPVALEAAIKKYKTI